MEELVKVLLARGAEIDKKDDNGRTPLLCSAFSRCKEVIQVLLDRGADPVKTNNGGQTPLSMARIRALCPHPHAYEAITADWEIVKTMEDEIAKRGQRD